MRKTLGSKRESRPDSSSIVRRRKTKKFEKLQGSSLIKSRRVRWIEKKHSPSTGARKTQRKEAWEYTRFKMKWIRTLFLLFEYVTHQHGEQVEEYGNSKAHSSWRQGIYFRFLHWCSK